MSCPPASARSEPRAQSYDALLACRSIADAQARLACFDARVAALQGAVEAKEVRVVGREEVREANRSLFGLRLPKLRIFGGGEDEIKQIDGVIASATKGGDGRLYFTLKDGGSWMQTDDWQVPGQIRPGTKVTIKRGVLTSFFANFERGPGIKVRRVN